jgi:ribosomal protein S18 acetylase RimI-like enzyme
VTTFQAAALPRAPDRFDEWLTTPLSHELGDERFAVSRAHPKDFEAIYALVNAAFGVRRPRAQFEWWYRDNPHGLARCWLVHERRTGRLVSTSAHVPWPLARGDGALWGLQLCDIAVLPDQQRLGITQMRREAQALHPHYAEEYRIGWPNTKSLGMKRKHGHDDEILGPLREGCFALTPADHWLPRALARMRREPRRAGTSDPASGALRVESVKRFDSDIDRVTLGCMSWPGFWCPHDSDFLNWRYLEHPSESHLALAVYEGPDAVGYCVFRSRGSSALLMEFAAPAREAVTRLLLDAAKEAAVRAGCSRLFFHATPLWPHWGVFAEAGFVERPGDRCYMVIDPEPHDARALERWQLVPGDQDVP